MGSAGTLTAQEAVQAVNDGIIANIGALDGAVSAIVERVTAGLTAQAARLNQIGVDMTKYIASGMTTGTPNITNIIPQYRPVDYYRLHRATTEVHRGGR